MAAQRLDRSSHRRQPTDEQPARHRRRHGKESENLGRRNQRAFPENGLRQAAVCRTQQHIVSILFTYGVPANATLNINTTGAKAIWYRNAAIVADIIGAGDTATFMYNGTHYVLISLDKNTQSNLSDLTNDISGLATCSTPSATNAKVAVLADFALVTGAIVAVRFT